MVTKEKQTAKIGDIKFAYELGLKGHPRYIWHACIICGNPRWVLYQKGEPSDLICRHCKRNGPEAKPVRQRLLSNIQTEGECWVWQGHKNNWGYGLIKVQGEILAVHRVAYEEFVAPIPNGLDIDHLCRNRMCINPAHLEPVSRRVNVQRGLAGKYPSNGMQERRKTHCPHGHPYDLINTYVNKKGWRECRACWVEKNQRRRERNNVN